MTGYGISEDDELTPEGLSRDKSELFSGTALGDAIEKKEEERHEKLTKARKLVEAKVALANAREAGVEDPAVEALASAVEGLSEETEAAALVEHHEEVEAREKISELEALAGTSTGPLAEKYAQKAESLRKKHGIDDGEEPSRYDRIEALVANGDEDDESTEAEALAAHKSRKAQQEADEEMDPEDRQKLANFKTLKNSTSSEKVADKYQQKIDELRASYQ